MSKPHPAVEQLSKFNHKNPGLWECFAKVMSVPVDTYWPTWCWAPATVFAEAIKRWDPITNLAHLNFQERVSLYSRAECFGAWRATQGIYRLHPTLLEELWSTPLDGTVPVEALQRLPAWCVYIELEAPDTKPLKYADFNLRGFWIHLSTDLAKNPSLGLMFLDANDLLVIYHLRLMRTIEESFEVSKDAGHDTDQATRNLAKHALSVALYLCADETEVPERKPPPPRWVKGKKRPLMPVAKNPEVHACGYRIGAALDFAKKQRAAREATATPGSAPIPHVRRAHWHTYWTGPRKSQGEQRPVLKWLHPILVGGVLPEEATLREVL